MSLFGPSWQVSQAGGYVLVTFARPPAKELRDPVKAHGFRPRSELTWARKADANGLAAAEWLGKRLQELTR